MIERLRRMPPKKIAMTVGLVVVVTFAATKAVNSWTSRMTPEKIAAGKVLFTHEWTENDSLSGGGDGLGPVFNERSCVACHSQGGIGGSSGNDFNVAGFDVFPVDGSTPFSNVVHSFAVAPAYEEDIENVQRMFPIFSDQLVIPASSYSGDGCEGMPPAKDTIILVNKNPVAFHQLNSPALFGVGLIDEISSLSLSIHGTRRAAARLSDEFSGKFSGNGIGMTRLAQGGIGKFGWKGQFASLEEFVATACAMEIGLTNPNKDQPIPRQHKPNKDAKMDMTRKQLHELVCFVRSLPRPEQILPSEKSALIRVTHGERMFHKIGCADCHVQDIGHVKNIYSDFHLYNLEDFGNEGSPYGADSSEGELDFNRSHPDRDQWQTPPLWGVADSAPYFHDGASPTLEKAILRHKGQAMQSRKQFRNLSTGEREMVIEFLSTLRAPQSSKPISKSLATSK